VIINPPTADVPAGDANTDTLLIAYGNNEGPPEGDVITAINGSPARGSRRRANYSVGSAGRSWSSPRRRPPQIGCT
jgi:hypothetical protein